MAPWNELGKWLCFPCYAGYYGRGTEGRKCQGEGCECPACTEIRERGAAASPKPEAPA